MRLEAGFIRSFDDALSCVPVDVLSQFEGALKHKALLNLLQLPVSEPFEAFDDAPELTTLDYASPLCSLGTRAVGEHQVAFCVLAGGAPWRLNSSSDALTPIPGVGMPMLYHKIVDIASSTGSSPFNKSFPRTWIIIDPTQRSSIERIVWPDGLTYSTFLGSKHAFSENIQFLNQFQTFALTPLCSPIVNNDTPLGLPAGSGDAIEVLTFAGVLKEFIDNGGKYVVFSNANNASNGSYLHALLGQHISSQADATCLTVPRLKGDVGGSVMYADGKLIVVEDDVLMSPVGFEQKYLNTGTFVVNVHALTSAVEVPWRYVRTAVNTHNSIMLAYRRKITQVFEHLQRVQYVVAKRRTTPRVQMLWQNRFVFSSSPYMPLRNVTDVNLFQSVT